MFVLESMFWDPVSYCYAEIMQVFKLVEKNVYLEEDLSVASACIPVILASFRISVRTMKLLRPDGVAKGHCVDYSNLT